MSRRVIPEFVENPHKLSEEEFTRKLFIWFQDQGMMSEARTHLRSLLITSLKGTPLGPKALNVGSPKSQAINLMIAEFLIEQQYHYTLSVFSSEVPLKDFTTLTVGNLAASGEGFPDAELHPRYKECFVKDILETLGFSPQSEESIKICSFYNDNEESLSLIACVFKVVSELLRRRQDLRKKVVNEGNNFVLDTPIRDTDDQTFKDLHSKQNFEGTEEIFSVDIQNIFSLSALKTEHVEQLYNEIKKCIHNKVTRVQQEEESKYKQELLNREKNIQENLVLRETFFQQLVEDSNTRIENERQDMIKGRQEMKELAGQLRERHCQLVARCTELEDWGQSLKSKEIQIEEMKHQETLRATEKNCQLDFRKHQLDQEFERLQKEHEELELLRQGVIELKRSLENAHQNIAKEAPSIYNLQEECIYLRKQLDSARNLLKKKTSTAAEEEIQPLNIDEKQVDKNLLQQMLVTKELSRQLQQENGELRARTRQQDRRIEELTTRAADLVTQLEDAKTGLNQLSHQELPIQILGKHPGNHLFPSSFGDHKGIDTATDSVPVNQQRVRERQRAGAGEESPWKNCPDENDIDIPAINTQASKSVQTKEPRKKLYRRLAVYHHFSSDESSPTEEILVEAKRRLRSLEEESEAVDRKFREFRERQPMHYNSSQYITSSYPYNTESNCNNLNVNHQPGFTRPGKSLPTHSKTNGRTAFYQEPEVYTQSRFGRMTDLQTHTSSDPDNSFIISQISPISSRRSNRNFIPDKLLKNSSPSPVQTNNMQSELHPLPLSSQLASPTQNKNVVSVQSSIQLNALAVASTLSPHPQTKDTNSNLKLTSNYSTRISHSVEVPQRTNANMEEKFTAATENVDYSSPFKERPNNIGLSKEKSEENSLIASNTPKPNNFDQNDSILVYMNTAPARHSSDSEENPHPLGANTPKTIAEIARENAERVREQLVIEPTPPLEHPDSRLEPLTLVSKNAALFSSTEHDNNATPSANTTAEEMKKKKGVTALSGTTSGSGFESSLPALQNISLSSIELSSDHPASDANSKGKGSNSEDDFWA